MILNFIVNGFCLKDGDSKIKNIKHFQRIVFFKYLLNFPRLQPFLGSVLDLFHPKLLLA